MCGKRIIIEMLARFKSLHLLHLFRDQRQTDKLIITLYCGPGYYQAYTIFT